MVAVGRGHPQEGKQKRTHKQRTKQNKTKQNQTQHQKPKTHTTHQKQNKKQQTKKKLLYVAKTKTPNTRIKKKQKKYKTHLGNGPTRYQANTGFLTKKYCSCVCHTQLTRGVIHHSKSRQWVRPACFKSTCHSRHTKKSIERRNPRSPASARGT